MKMEKENKKRLDRGWLYSAIKDVPTYDAIDHLLEKEETENIDDSMYIIEIFLDDDYS